MLQPELKIGLTFDDVLLVPAKSNVLPNQVELRTRLSRNIELQIPLLSAAMDTVTESGTAIAMAQFGGLGVIHRNMPIQDQALEVDRVKKAVSGMILNPITMQPDQQLHEATEIMQRYHISGLPVVSKGKLVGILTNRDLRFVKDLDQKISKVMTKRNLITVPPGTTLEEAKDLLHQNRIEKLPVVDDQFRLKGLITIKDIEKSEQYPNSAKDDHGRYMVGAAVGTGEDTLQRVAALLDKNCDVIVLDTAHGHSKGVIEVLKKIKASWPDAEVIAGNVATKEGTLALIRAGADAIKVGMGPGSICTTRVVAGVGVPQISAVDECARAARRHDVPVIADGGIKYSGDAAKALAAGAHTCMLGGMLAGTEESPGEIILYQGRSYKVYRGMGSIEAMKQGSADRYRQAQTSDESKLVPEGIEGRVPYKGSIGAVLFQMIGGIRSGMGYTGCRTIEEMHTKGRFIRISSASLRESHVHDVIITKEAPNYRVD
ncbi:MAG: IMP dehydrogenase [Candidatus Alcyoniella australis]|nr:IMP dehydrogenase [Candidatus Alcyoniella australis]